LKELEPQKKATTLKPLPKGAVRTTVGAICNRDHGVGIT